MVPLQQLLLLPHLLLLLHQLLPQRVQRRRKKWGKWEELGFITWRRKGRGRYEAEVAGKHDPLIIKVLILPHLRNEDSEGRWMVEDLKI